VLQRLVLWFLIVVSAHAQNGWTWRNPLPNSFFWRGLSVCDNEIYLAGERAIARSTNGINWDFTVCRQTELIVSVTKAGDRLMALGFLEAPPTEPVRSGVFVSRDGAGFSFLTELPGVFTKILYGNGRFLASYRDVISSADGKKWSVVDGGKQSTDPDTDILFAGGRFLYTAGSGVYFSTTGLDWEASYSVPAMKLAYHEGVYAAAAPGYVSFSKNARDWETHPVPKLASSIRGLAIGPSGTVVVGDALYREAADALYSSDGTNWTLFTLPFPDRAWEVSFFKDRYLMVGNSGLLADSTDGFAWRRQKTGDSTHLAAVASGNGRIVALGLDDQYRMAGLWSSNGIQWSAVESPVSNVLASVVFADEKFVGVGWNGHTAVSKDGIRWIEGERESMQDLFDVTHSPLGFVAAGRGIVMRSEDGLDWKREEHPPIVMYDIAYGNGVFIVSGASMWPYAFRSTNLQEWIKLPTPVGEAHRIEFGNGTFVAAVWDSVYASRDGINWTRGDQVALSAITFSEGVFCGSGNYNVYVSSDGLRWHRFYSPARVRAAKYFGRIFGFGEHGTIIEATTLGAAGITASQGKAALNAMSLGNRPFQFQKSSNLVDWSDVAALNGIDSLEVRTDAGTQEFFRLILQSD